MTAAMTATELRRAFRHVSGAWLVGSPGAGALPVPVTVASSMAGAPLIAGSAHGGDTPDQVARLLWQPSTGLPLVSITGALRDPTAADLARLHRRATALGLAVDNTRAHSFQLTRFELVDPCGGDTASWSAADWLLDAPETLPSPGLQDNEQQALDHLNTDHPEIIEGVAARLGLGAGAWRAVGIDPDGMDVVVDGRLERLPFPRLAWDFQGLKGCLKELAGPPASAGQAPEQKP
jgi:hypothetical protein